MLRLLPKTFWLQAAGVLALLVAIVFAGRFTWNLLSNATSKARVAQLEVEVSELENKLTTATYSKNILEWQLASRKRAYENLRDDAARRANLAAEQERLAEVDLARVKADYAKLRRDWPEDCVSAVELVRERRGL